ncbi:minor tail protein [Mycobacterium phage MrMiyagi]|uniref:Minor tail protein n=1 Tax=Mycobacterium phage MrMiyagi TaxID=2762395 RepID=A0A7G8LPR6_9CAUD|nr:minor tail protein [Mycobacterium phage MrMiyagi]
MSYANKFRFVIEDVHGNILARDVVAQGVQVVRQLSGPCQIEFQVHPKEPSIQHPDGSGPIQLKPWGHWIHAIRDGLDGEEIVWASGIMQPSDVDPTTGILQLKAEGFSNYPKGIPWLQNWNPIAVDPFEIVTRIWNHIQSQENGNLGVTVYPTSSGTQMLPGFSFNNEQMVQDFFAIFIRAVDRLDCGDYISKLARDIPFDFLEESSWTEDRTGITKKIHLGYPKVGVYQTDLTFRLGENVNACTPKQPSEIEWTSGFTYKGYFPGKEYYASFENADPDRYRRVMDEEDLNIDSNERAKAWARRKLTRRQIPHYFESVVIDPYHPNAPFGSFDVGDSIDIQGPMPWVGDVKQEHKILMHIWDETKGVVELKTMAEGAFNYDPIEYIPQGG